MNDAAGLDADLGEIVAFTRVVQAGSFTAAAGQLAMPKSTVSRKIAELEARVGARLLQRSTRAVSLTDLGRVYYEHCVRVVGALEEAQRALTSMQGTPKGRLRVTIPPSFAVLGPLVATYLSLYPEVDLDLVVTDRRVDLIAEGFDLGLRAGAVPDSSLVARKVGVVRRGLYAAPALVRRLGAPKSPEALEDRPCVAFAPEGDTWSLAAGARRRALTVRPRFVVNDYELLRAVVREGFGFALLPEYQCLDDLAAGRLVRVLGAWSAPDVPVMALYPSTRHVAPKVVALMKLLTERLSARMGPQP
ncbi:MAG: LysR family transcriptional regulator [Myxococcales bacterium]|nr:LysR family transcriptional regulator [Myxococcales bacterium]